MNYLVGLGFGFLVCAWIISYEIRFGVSARRIELGSEAFFEYLENGRRFDEWRAARPFLYVRQCEYATGLVLAMIDSYERYILYRGATPSMEHNLLALRTMLEEQPPRHDPPKPRQRGLSF